MNAKTSVAAICLVAMLSTRTAHGADADVGKELDTARQLLKNARDHVPASDLISLEQKLSDAEDAYSAAQRALDAACEHNSKALPECAARAGNGNNTTPYMAAGVGGVVAAGPGAAMTALAILAALTYATTSLNEGEDALLALRDAREGLRQKIAALAATAETVLAKLKRGKDCNCICGDPNASITKRKSIGRMPEYECRAACPMLHGFPVGEYTCQ